MLRSLQKLNGYHIIGTDDTVGFVDDFYMDDEVWIIRYLVVDTGSWLQ